MQNNETIEQKEDLTFIDSLSTKPTNGKQITASKTNKKESEAADIVDDSELAQKKSLTSIKTNTIVFPWYLRLYYFIKTLFFGSKTPYTSKFFIKREIKTILENFSPSFYDFRLQKVKINLATYVYEIYVYLRELVSLFKEVFQRENEINFNLDIFYLSFTDNLLSEEAKNLLNSIDEEYFIEVVTNEENPDDVIKEKLDELKGSIEYFNNMQAIIHYTLFFERLLLLSQFNFKSFFCEFDPQFSEEYSYEPKFQAIYKTNDILGIKKLASHIKLIDFEVIPKNVLIHFDQTIGDMKKKIETQLAEDKSEDNVNKEYLSKLLSRLQVHNSKKLSDIHQKIYKLYKENILESIVKIVTKDYMFEPSLLEKKDKLLFRQYLRLVLAKKRYINNMVYQKIKDTLTLNEVLNYFNISSPDELLQVKNYTQQTSDVLVEKGNTGLSYVLVVSMFKTYYEKRYKGTISKFINNLLVKGDFIDKKEHVVFSEASYDLEKTINNFFSLDSEISSGEKDFGQILRYVQGTISDNRFRDVIEKKIHDTDSRIRKILKDALGQYGILLNFIRLCIEDWKKSSTPKLISNIKSIAGPGRDFYYHLVRSEESLNQFLKIITKIMENNSESES
ncbi:MAG: DUF5312 domain-containing protein [Spirochaetota bacterium]|nr:DUF5312 domain-containing protein [Spirochaetota bacterium]